jgi:hypothetical protein
MDMGLRLVQWNPLVEHTGSRSDGVKPWRTTVRPSVLLHFRPRLSIAGLTLAWVSSHKTFRCNVMRNEHHWDCQKGAKDRVADNYGVVQEELYKDQRTPQ